MENKRKFVFYRLGVSFFFVFEACQQTHFTSTIHSECERKRWRKETKNEMKWRRNASNPKTMYLAQTLKNVAARVDQNRNICTFFRHQAGDKQLKNENSERVTYQK